MSIEIRNLSKRFGTFQALDDVSLDIDSGELVALLGPSGCGKTTLLRIIAGLDHGDAGQVLFHGEDATSLDVRNRGVGFVFQHYALFRHMTVFDNVAFGLKVRPRSQRLAREEIAERVYALLRMVQLDFMADRLPNQLSGGQRQRVALARALAVEPRVLLLDEPFGALDAQVRKDLRRWLRRLHDELHVTSVFVTHDQEEAMEVSDRVVVMNRGRIEQAGAPAEIYDEPANPFVYRFVGQVNELHARVDAGWADVAGLRLAAPEHGAVRDQAALVYVRPHELEVRRDRPDGDGFLEVDIEAGAVAGPVIRLDGVVSGTREVLQMELPRGRPEYRSLGAGDRVFVRPLNPKVFLDKENGAGR